MSEKPLKPGIYQHYKGQRYQVYGVASHSETEERVVIYRCLYDQFDLWVRPLAMFIESVTVNNESVPRFQWVSEADASTGVLL